MPLPKVRRFTYGDQFDPVTFVLTDLLELCVKNEPDRYRLQGAVKSGYFEGHGMDPAQREENSNKMAMNCLLSLNAYGLIKLRNNGRTYSVSELTRKLPAAKEKAGVHRIFAKHILTNLEGLLLCRLSKTSERVTNK